MSGPIMIKRAANTLNDEATSQKARELIQRLSKVKGVDEEKPPKREDENQDTVPAEPGIFSAMASTAIAGFAIAGAGAVAGATRLFSISVLVGATILATGAVLGKLTHDRRVEAGGQRPVQGRQNRKKRVPVIDTDTEAWREGTLACMKTFEISGDKEWEIDSGGCQLEIPKGAIDGSCELKVFTMFNEDLCPEGYMSVTSFLDVDLPKPLLAPIRVRLEGVCAVFQEAVQVDILHLDDGADNWAVTNTIPLPNNAILEFACMDFSPILVALKEKLMKKVKYVIKTAIIFKGDNTFRLACYLHHSLAKGKAEESRNPREFNDFNVLVVHIGDSLIANIAVYTDPRSDRHHGLFKVLPSDFFTLKIDRNFVRAKYINLYGTVSTSDLTKTFHGMFIPIWYCVKKNGENEDGPHCFNYCWKKIEPAREESTSKAGGDVANLIAGGASNVTYNQYGTSITATSGAQVQVTAPQEVQAEEAQDQQ